MKKALMITGGHIDGLLLKSAYESNAFDYILGVDGGCNGLYLSGIIPDAIIGDFDSIEKVSMDYFQGRGCEIIQYEKKKDFTDTELAIGYLIKKGLESVHI
ncbi:MAG: thiamine diphosphokinase, partial [Vallitaleaceae bacterium]|nr:thiamine diphosphokinase [Vallitaleaceae bacterium]